ncbi:MAG TPA: three-Cys-motif partner protein TcmP [Chitinivibrionales bacterium]|nr:three-Cys-motif partner protein TcmP [Chitinivibrionales bacterium]
MKKLKYDELGYWSEVKLSIIKEYVDAYTKIMAGQKYQFKCIYVDAFAGAGKHVSKQTGEIIDGSPVNALKIKNKFHEYHFIDINDLKIAELEAASKELNNVFIYPGDCNKIIEGKVFPRAKYEDYKRAVCLLDPYGIHLDWNLIKKAGEMKSVEIFLNFPIMDINRNALKHEKEKVDDKQILRMNRFWGDETWREVGYTKSQQQDLFGEPRDEKVSNEEFEQTFRKRLKEIAGFKFVPEPMPMRNSNNSIVYYLYFAGQNETGKKIIEGIFKKYAQMRDE